MFLNHLYFLYNISLGISSVNDLDLDFSNNPYITWSPPSFYSEDIPHGSITTYHVYVKNVNYSVVADVNTTDTFYQLPSNLTICDSYNASVTAFTEQYSSLVKTATKGNSGGKIILIIHSMFYCFYQIMLLTYLVIL